jgi:S-(hydroxymethyl)glutathione dehydrogenase/alcohol dehydrogenase
MRAAVFLEAHAPLEVEEVELLPPGPQDVVVRVTATALCQTDVSVRAGKYDYGAPMVMGHEACGVVEAVGSAVTRLKPGDRVISSTAPCCGVCANCTAGRPNICVLGLAVRKPLRARRADGSLATGLYGLGSFAEQMCVHEASLIAIRTAIPDAQLALIGCGVTTGLGAVLNRTDLKPGGSLAAIGCGAVGLAAIQGARIAGAEIVIGIDPRAERRADALRLGASAVIDPQTENVPERVRELTAGLGADACIDAVGLPATATQAYDLTRQAGTVIVVGLPPRGETYTFDAWPFFLSEKRFSSSLFGSADIRRDFPKYVSFAEEGRLDLGGLVSRIITLDQVNEGLDALAAGEVIRAVIVQGATAN